MIHVVVGPPPGAVEIGGDAGISNHSFTVDPGIEDRLRAGGTWTRYAAWHFNGLTWFADGLFWCQVWSYGIVQETITAGSLLELMHAVSDKYGYE